MAPRRWIPRWLRRPSVLIPVAVVMVAAISFGAYWFQPWKLWTDTTVHDELPVVAVATTTSSSVSSSPVSSSPVSTPAPSTPTTSAPTSLPPAGPVALSRGTFITHEHGTSGTVTIVQYPDGRRVLAIANLNTSDGPDVHVWLTDQQVTKDGWHVFDDGRYVNLGGLRGNKGNLVYPIPASVDLDGLISVSIWCDRFDVSFGAAALQPA